MKTNIVINILKPILSLAKRGSPVMSSNAVSQGSLRYIAGFFKIYLKEEVNGDFIFGMQINIEVFHKLILSFGCV